ncbi:MAG TPA: type I-C CRISPR-associated protein Cas8c/Csd1 [Verrucomicrobia bacterium]|nr:type I-C CRISPR-associated protein Cas8c/Csd1 [Verrucomicrobiota bacterium]
MILQALKEYYDRKAADPDSGIAPLGWEKKEIPYLIVLDSEGRLVNVEDTQEKVGKKLRAQSFLVPQSVKRTVGVEPYFLWDNVEYVTGILCKEGGRQDRVAKQHEAFMARIQPYTSVSAIGAVSRFLSSSDLPSQLETFDAWKEARQSCAFVAFKFAGEKGTIFDEPEVKRVVNGLHRETEGDFMGVDLVSGEQDAIALLHPALKGIPGANTTGANIVSFNFPAARSFGKAQGNNSPVGVRSAFAYTTALNTLLAKDSKQKISVGDATVVFWAGRKSSFEGAMLAFFSEPPKDDPDRLQQHVAALFKSPQTGSASFSDDPTAFYVLGLAPNAARIAIRFWHVGTVAEMAERFRTYFDDLLMVHGPKDRDHLSLWRLLVSTAVQGKSENIAPNLAGNVMRSILEGLPFPETLLQSVLTRIKAEHEVTYARAKLIKGCLNRKWRFNNPNKERSLAVSLDIQNANIGYRLGRLFAVLEKIQEAVSPNINATIKDKFYGAASTSPNTVFANLMRLSSNHLSKLKKEKPGYAVNLEKTLQEIVSSITSFPAHLSLDDQGQFAIGYYHQRQDFFTKKDSE